MRLLSQQLFGLILGLILVIQLGVGPLAAAMAHPVSAVAEEIPDCCSSNAADHAAMQMDESDEDGSMPKRGCCDVQKSLCHTTAGSCVAVLPGFVATLIFALSSDPVPTLPRGAMGLLPPPDYDPPRL